MQFLLALQTLELVTIAVILVCQPALTVTAPLTRVLRCNVVRLNSVFFGLVLDVVFQFAERPLLEL